MAKQDVITIGASAGGVEALQVLVGGLPSDLEAAIFVVLHIGSGLNGRSLLSEILSKAGPLPVAPPTGIEKIQHGRIYVARPDCHLIVRDGHVRAVYGPKENRARPAINPLFRSAAAVYGPRVAGVILTGMQDDGVAGLAEIKRRGGVAIVQDPSTATFHSMPQSAIKHVKTDYVLPIQQIPGILSKLAATDRVTEVTPEPMEKTLLQIQCPECGGPLWKEQQGGIVEYCCRVGHRYSPLALKEEHAEALERSLWGSVVTLENAADISEKLAAELGPDYAQDALDKRARAKSIRETLEKST